MTFTSSTTSGRGLRPRFFLEVQGLEPLLVDATILGTASNVLGNVPSSLGAVTARTQIVAIMKDGLEPGQSSLDFENRKSVGGELKVSLRDEDSLTLRALFQPRKRRTAYLTGNIAKGTAMSGAGTLNVSTTTGVAVAGSGAAASITTVSGNLATLTGLSGMTSSMVGTYLVVTGAASGLNNGTWRIETFLGATSVQVRNARAVGSDANNGSISWSGKGLVYVNRETFAFTGTTGTTLTGVSRAQYGSRAQDHFGGADDGAGVYLSPSSWTGRKVTLYAVYLDDSGRAGSSSSDVGTLGIYRMDGAPKWEGEGGRWSLSCSELSNGFRARECYVGINEMHTPDGGTPMNYGTPPSVTVDVTSDQAKQFVVSTATSPATTYVKFAIDNGAWWVLRLASVASTSLTVETPGRFLSPDFIYYYDNLLDPSIYPPTTTSFQHVAVFSDNPAAVTLKLLLSQLGDGANDATYDVLPGRLRDQFEGYEWRLGAGLDAADVDIAAFEAMAARAAVQWDLFLDQPIKVEEILQELCDACGCYDYIDSQGRLSVAPIQDHLPPGSTVQSVTITDSTLSLASSEALEYDEGTIRALARQEMNWDPIQRKYLAHVNVTSADILARFPDSERLDLDTRLVGIKQTLRSGGDKIPQHFRRRKVTTLLTIENQLRDRMKAGERGRLYFNATVAWDAALISLGQTVQVTNARIPDLEGSTLAAQNFLVVGRKLDLQKMQVSLKLLFMDRGCIIAPAAVITALSTSGGKDTLTLSTTDPTALVPSGDPATGAPAKLFAAGWGIKLFDVSGAALGAFTVDAIVSNTQLRLTTTVASVIGGYVLEAGVDFIFPQSYGSVGSGAAVSGFSPTDFAYQVPASQLLGGIDAPTRWG